MFFNELKVESRRFEYKLKINTVDIKTFNKTNDRVKISSIFLAFHKIILIQNKLNSISFF
jgi:hypothetical protein